MVSSAKCIRSTTRRMMAMGQGEPAMMPVRRLDRSKPAKCGMIEFGDEHRRYAVKCRAALLDDGLHGRDRIEAAARIDHGGAVGEAREIAHHHAEAMIERHRDADPVVGRKPHRPTDEIAVVEDVAVGQRHALRRPRGSAGELDVGRVVGRDRKPEVRHARHLGRTREAGDGHRTRWSRPSRGGAEQDHAAQRREPGRREPAGFGAPPVRAPEPRRGRDSRCP